MNDLEQLAEQIFEIAMDDYDMKIRTESDPEARAVLTFHRSTAESVARHYALRQAHELLANPVPEILH